MKLSAGLTDEQICALPRSVLTTSSTVMGTRSACTLDVRCVRVQCLIDDERARSVFSAERCAHELAGLTDGYALARFGATMTRARIAELLRRPIADNFDLQHLKKIHRQIFQDV